MITKQKLQQISKEAAHEKAQIIIRACYLMMKSAALAGKSFIEFQPTDFNIQEIKDEVYAHFAEEEFNVSCNHKNLDKIPYLTINWQQYSK